MASSSPPRAPAAGCEHSISRSKMPPLGRFCRRNEAAKLGPGQVGPHHDEAGADEAAQATQVVQVRVGHRPQGGQHALPHRVLDETLPHVLASMMPRNTMTARAGHGANQPRGYLTRQNFVPGPQSLRTGLWPSGQPEPAPGCSATIRMSSRIASPELRPDGGLLPHLICSPLVWNGRGGHGADQHGDA